MSHSESASSSVSDSCCVDTLCDCEAWLTAFCDYETVTLNYCGEETEFTHARSKEVPMSAVNPQAGVFQTDKVFRVSMLEATIDVGIGATITEDDEDETVWIVYAVRTLTQFCVKVLSARSISRCFQLLETIDVLELDCQAGDCCTDEVRYKRVGRVKGKILAETGTLSSRHDSKDLIYSFSGSLDRWPLGTRPNANHRLKDKSGSYRITRVQDGGIFVPYFVELEMENADCSVRGS